MSNYGNSFIIKALNLDDTALKDIEFVRKIRIFVLLSVIAAAVALSTSFLGLMKGDMRAFYMDWFIIGTILIHLLILKNTHNFKTTATSVFIILGLIMFTNRIFGKDDFDFMLLFGYPIAACYLLGVRRGMLISFALFVSILFIMFSRYLDNDPTYQEKTLFIKFIISYLIVLFFSAILESAREHTHDRLSSINKKLESLSLQDSLTGLYNLKFFDLALTREVKAYKRRLKAFSTIILDIDHFTSFNDQYGQQVGDRILARIGEALQRSASRATDIVCYHGEAKFGVILPETSASGSVKVAQRIQKEISFLGIDNTPHGRLGVSMGIYTADQDESPEPKDITRMGNEALFEAKETGRNRFCVYMHETETETESDPSHYTNEDHRETMES